MCSRERDGKEGDWNKWRRKLLVDSYQTKVNTSHVILLVCLLVPFAYN